MTPPEYEFYMGRSVTAGAIKGMAYSITTGTAGSNSFALSTDKVRVSSGLVYIDYTPHTNEIFQVFAFDSGLKFIESFSLPGASGVTEYSNEGIISLPEDTQYVAFTLASINASIREMHEEMAKKPIVRIYEMYRVSPHYKSLKKKYEKETGQQFFRTTLEGTLTFFGSDYDIVNSAGMETKFMFSIVRPEEVTTVTSYNSKKEYGLRPSYFRGCFVKTDCKFDHPRRKLEPKLSPMDDYTDILARYEDTHNLIELAPGNTPIRMNKRPVMQIYMQGEKTVSNFFGNTYWETEVSDPVDSDNDLEHKYFFAHVGLACEMEITDVGETAARGMYAGFIDYETFINSYGYVTLYNKDNSYKIVAQYNNAAWIIRTSDNVTRYSAVIKNNTLDAIFYNVDSRSDFGYSKNAIRYDIWQRLLCNQDTIQDGTGVKNTYDIPKEDPFYTQKGVRNYKKCIGLLGGLFFCTSRKSTEPTKYGMDDYGEYFTDQFIPATAGVGRPLPICRNGWANASLWYVYNDVMYSIWETRLRTEYTLKDSYPIQGVIRALLKKADPLLTHNNTCSTFLYSATIPGNIPMARFNVCLTQRTNILKGEYDQAAQRAETSLKDILEMLANCFKCYWYIDSGQFRIEHISFFMNGGNYTAAQAVQLDLTSLRDQFNGLRPTYFQGEVEYDKSELSSRYELSWADDTTEMFGPVNIDVNSLYIQQDKVEQVNMGDLASDVDLMLLDPAHFSEDGFALLCPMLVDGVQQLPIVKVTLKDANGNSYETSVQNWYAALPYLVRFWMFDMPGYDIEVDALTGEQYAYGIKRCMQHKVEFFSKDDPDALKLIKTQFGNGQISGLQINLDTRLVEATLDYTPR